MKTNLYKLLNIFFSKITFSKNYGLRVLAYHDLNDASIFEDHLRFLVSSGYNIIDINSLKNHLFNNEKLPLNSVLITFDDGDVSVLDLGLPILQKYDLPSVMFVITGLIDSDNTFWCRWVELALQNQGKLYAESRLVVNSLKKCRILNEWLI